MDFSHWKFHGADAYEQRQQNAPQALTLIPGKSARHHLSKMGDYLAGGWTNPFEKQ